MDAAAAGLDLRPRAHVPFLRRRAKAFGSDNLKSGVNKASFYDPEINRTYGAMAAHYGVGILPARPGKPTSSTVHSRSSYQRTPDGFSRPLTTPAVVPARLEAKLIDAGWAKEVKAPKGAPVWRRDANAGRAFGLKLTTAGMEAIATAGDEPGARTTEASKIQVAQEAAVERANSSAASGERRQDSREGEYRSFRQTPERRRLGGRHGWRCPADGSSDWVLGSTARDISGSNPSRSTRKSPPAAVASGAELNHSAAASTMRSRRSLERPIPPPPILAA